MTAERGWWETTYMYGTQRIVMAEVAISSATIGSMREEKKSFLMRKEIQGFNVD
jgi:hypothetical protein